MCRHLSLIVLCFLLILISHTPINALDAPTDGEWAPVKASIDGNEQDAPEQLEALIKNRLWPEGWVLLAELHFNRGHYTAAAKHALTAFRQGGADEFKGQNLIKHQRLHATWLLIASLNKQGRLDKAEHIYGKLANQRTLDGLLHFHGAENAFLRQRYEVAQKRLALAQQEARHQLADFSFLKARILEKQFNTQAYPEAITLYETGLEQAENSDARFNLGRLQQALAHRSELLNQSLLEKAEQNFRFLLRQTEKNTTPDPNTQLALGFTLLDLKKFDQAAVFLTQATHSFGNINTSDQAQALRGLGTARLNMALAKNQYALFLEAVEALEASRELGATDPDIANNLLNAYMALSQHEQSKDISKWRNKIAALGGYDINTAIHPITKANTLFEQASQLISNEPLQQDQARLLLDKAIQLYADQLDAPLAHSASWHEKPHANNQESIPMWLYLGHCHELYSTLVQQSDKTDLRDMHHQAALTAYMIGANQGDQLSQSFYYATGLNAALNDADRYQVAIQMRDWQPNNKHASSILLATYASSGRWRRGLHLLFWGALCVIPLGLFLRTKFKPTPSEIIPARTRNRNDGSSADRPAAPRPKAPNKQVRETLLPDTQVRQPRNNQALEPSHKANQRRAVGGVARRIAQNRRQSSDGPRRSRRH